MLKSDIYKHSEMRSVLLTSTLFLYSRSMYCVCVCVCGQVLKCHTSAVVISVTSDRRVWMQQIEGSEFICTTHKEKKPQCLFV